MGRGSFGEVYRAFDPTLQRHVALKLLLPRGLDPDAEASSLLNEARAMARIRHPNVVPIYGVDQHEGRVGFWSDFVQGRTLSDLLATQGPLGPREAALVGIDVCRAVGAVHAAGFVHRDIKAGNVMREEGGRILLMDFGLTHESGADSHPSGTPAYMAPELMPGAAGDDRERRLRHRRAAVQSADGAVPRRGRGSREDSARRMPQAPAGPCSTCGPICRRRWPTWSRRRSTPIRAEAFRQRGADGCRAVRGDRHGLGNRRSGRRR